MEDQKIDDLVAMIDQFMAGGGGHMDIHVNEHGHIQAKNTTSKTVTADISQECGTGSKACCVPTLFEGMDREFPDES